MMAIGNVNGEIARTLRGCDARDQKSIDEVLIALDGTPNKARLGANALVGTSMAVLHAAAAAAGVPLYAYLLGDRPAIMPIPEVQIFGGESTDDGRTWQSAILGENLGKYSFREWKIPVRLTLTSFRRRDEMNGIGLLASIPRFLRKGVGDHGIFEKQPPAK